MNVWTLITLRPDIITIKDKMMDTTHIYKSTVYVISTSNTALLSLC